MAISKVNQYQPGGTHYKQFGDLQPWDVIIYFGLGFLDGNAVKYLLRWRHKGGKLDLEKAKHYVAKLLDQLEREEKAKKRRQRKHRSK